MAALKLVPQNDQLILGQRAKRLAERQDLIVAAAAKTPILIFKLDQELFAILMGDVRAVVKETKLISVPGSDATILGAMPIKGEVHCIFNPELLLGLPYVASTRSKQSSRHILVLRVPGHFVGLAIDQIESIDHVDLNSADMKQTLGSSGRRFIKPQANAPLILIHDLNTLLRPFIYGEQQR